MIIKIEQLSSRVKQKYQIECGEISYLGTLGRYFRQQKIRMCRKDTSYIGRWKINSLFDYIPFRHLFGFENLRANFLLEKDNTHLAKLSLSHHGFYKSCYKVKLFDETLLNCYNIGKDSFNYVCIYYKNRQIALLQTFLSVENNKYKSKLYLLDEYSDYSEILSFFAIYYLNYNYTSRFNTFFGSSYGKEYTLSRYNDKYNEGWREENFPNDDFFGKINI